MICSQSGVLMKKPNNVLNWKGKKINDGAKKRLKSDYSLRDNQRTKWIITNDVVDTTIWTRFYFLANASINDYKSTYELVGGERTKTDTLQDFIEHLDKDDILPRIKLNAIQMSLDDNVFNVNSELKFRLCHALIAAECGNLKQ